MQAQERNQDFKTFDKVLNEIIPQLSTGSLLLVVLSLFLGSELTYGNAWQFYDFFDALGVWGFVAFVVLLCLSALLITLTFLAFALIFRKKTRF